MYLFLAVVGLHCCVGFSLAVVSEGSSWLCRAGLSLHQLFLLQSMGSRCTVSCCNTHAQQLRLSALVAKQHVGSSRTRIRSCPLQWQTDSLPRTTREALGVRTPWQGFLRDSVFPAYWAISQRREYEGSRSAKPWSVRPAPADAVTGVPAGRRGEERGPLSPWEGAHQDPAFVSMRADSRGPALQVAHAPLSLEGTMLSSSALSFAKDAFFASPQSCQTKTCLYFYLDSERFTL